MAENTLNKGRVILKDGKPMVILSEAANAVGGVCIQDGIALAKQLAHKIIEQKMGGDGINISRGN